MIPKMIAKKRITKKKPKNGKHQKPPYQPAWATTTVPSTGRGRGGRRDRAVDADRVADATGDEGQEQNEDEADEAR